MLAIAVAVAVAIVIALLGLAELGVRVTGAADIPLYDANARIGYILKPNQHGTFLGHDWAFNELSMGTARAFHPSKKVDVLLIGDSIVLGGNYFDQAKRLGPRLAAHTGWAVWPIAANSWGLQNELTYIADHPEVVRGIDRIIFVSNSGDFDGPSSWTLPRTHPRQRPVWQGLYLVKRLTNPLKEIAAPFPVRKDPDLVGTFRRTLSEVGKPVGLVFYSDKKDVGRPAPCHLLPSSFRAAGRWTCIADDPRWSKAAFKDDLHPTVAATDTLASIIAAQVQATDNRLAR